MKSIAFYTLGCKVNQADTAGMEALFRQAGYNVVPFSELADVYLINTCVVTNVGQRKSRQIINRALRRGPLSLTVVTGCYPQTAPEEVRAIKGIDVIIGNRERARIVELVEAAAARKTQTLLDNVEKLTAATQFEELPTGMPTEKTRAFLKIQEGCNQFCSFCIIPYARGPLRSRSLESIRAECALLAAAGYKEIVLIGIHLGCYGQESQSADKKFSLADAVKAALETTGFRLRLGSLESVEVDERLLELFRTEARLCKHLHLPLQSGSDKILRAMRRPYDTAKFAQLVAKIRAAVPDVAITTDIIVGFPGETEADFAATYQFAAACRFAKMHIFPYSLRKGTPAASMTGQVADTIKSARAVCLAELDVKLQQEILSERVGKIEEVLFEQPFAPGIMEGLTSSYLRVCVPGQPEELANCLRRVRITGIREDCLSGELLED